MRKQKHIYLLLLLALFFSGCETEKKNRRERNDLSYSSSKNFAFNSDKVKQDINVFISSRTASNGLIASFKDTAVYAFSMDTGRFHECVYGKMGYLDEQAFTYDLALSVIGLLLNGRQEHAEKILDALEEEFYLQKNGTYGLYNSYLLTSGIPVQDLHLGIDGDRIHTGPTLWVALASLNHAKLVRNTRYLCFVLDIADWCRNELTYYRFPDGERGAISMGIGWGPEWSEIFSTEHNVDYFAMLRMLLQIYEESPEDVRSIFKEKGIDDAWLKDEMDHIGRWIREIAFDKEKYCFVAGVNQFGIDKLRILDGTSWGIGGVGPENFEKWGIDLEKLVTHTEDHFKATYILPNGKVIKGFDFTDNDGYEGSRDPLVWFEGTGQLIIAYKELADHFAGKGDLEKERLYTNKAKEYTQDMYTFSYFYDLNGGLPYMTIRPREKEIVKTLKWEWEIPRGRDGNTWVSSVSSTMWLLYCIHDFYNPMKWSNH